MATSTEIDYTEYTGQTVTVVHNLPEPDEEGHETIETSGKVQVGNTNGILIKPKGQLQFKLIKADDIEEVFLSVEKSKPLKATKLQLVTIGQARRHLLERHGVTVKWANEVSEEQALEYHNSLDHVELDLGHVHEAKDSKKAESGGE